MESDQTERGKTMPRKLDTFEFPHGGRKGMEFDFESLCDGSIWQLEKGVDWDAGVPVEEARSAETFLGALSRYANEKGMRVNKDISSSVEPKDGEKPLNDVVTVRVRPKKNGEDNGSTTAPAATATKTAAKK